MHLYRLAKFLRVAGKIGTVIAVFGVVLDGVVAALALIEGSQQKSELQKAIQVYALQQLNTVTDLCFLFL